MFKFFQLILFLIFSFAFLLGKERIITIDGAITETVFALGAGNEVVGIDDTSFYPPQVNKIPRVGYIRTLNAEGILAMDPTLVLTSDGIKPPMIIKQIQKTGIQIAVFPASPSLENAYYRFSQIAKILNKVAEGEKLTKSIQSSLKQLKSKLKEVKTKPKVLFVLNMQGKSAMVAGKGTRPDWMIEYCGGQNVIDFQQWKNINDENIIKLNPDIVLYMEGHGKSKTSTLKTIKKSRSFALTEAVKNKKLFALDYAYYFNLGPRMADAAWDLSEIFHGKL